MKKILYNKSHPIKLNSFMQLASVLRFEESYLKGIIAAVPDSYKKIILKKKDGTPREIKAPYEDLKGVQNSILYNYLNKVKLSSCVFGCGEGKSILVNAARHRNGEYMLNFDIKNFFPSVHYKKVLKIFIELGCSEEVAEAICKLTTLDYCLPQGSRTSPYLASLALDNLDTRMFSLAKSLRLTYTRYFDDITFSGGPHLLGLQETIAGIIKSEGYIVKTEKKYCYGPNEDKKITGIIIRSDGTFDVGGKEDVLLHLNNLKNTGFSVIESSSIEKERLSLQGKIAFIESVNPKSASVLRDAFDLINWP